MILLRPAGRQDAEFLEDLLADDEYAFFAVDGMPSLADLERQITASDADFRIVCDARTAEPVGWISAEVDVANGTAAVGYGIARRHWGRGYATLAAREMVALLFARPEVHKVWARADPRNERSLKVLRNAGLIVEGTLESHFVRRGERVSRVLFGLTRDRWQASG
jgi:RimJ/RimL family protein N-acetyltransferase